MAHVFETEQWLPFPLPLVFAFFCNPQNLPPLMPAWQKARVEEVIFVAPPRPPAGSPARIATGAGTTMILSFRPLPFVPVRLNWHALIPEFKWNDHFCDTQTRGPMHFWRHCHSVRSEARNGVDGTVVHDRVEYALPGGVLGALAAKVGGTAQMRYIFGTRQRMTAKLMPLYAERRARAA